MIDDILGREMTKREEDFLSLLKVNHGILKTKEYIYDDKFDYEIYNFEERDMLKTRHLVQVNVMRNVYHPGDGEPIVYFWKLKPGFYTFECRYDKPIYFVFYEDVVMIFDVEMFIDVWRKRRGFKV